MTIEEILLNYWTLGIIFAIAILFFILLYNINVKRFYFYIVRLIDVKSIHAY